MGIWLIAAFLILWIVAAAVILISLCIVASRFDRLEANHLQEENENAFVTDWKVAEDLA